MQQPKYLAERKSFAVRQGNIKHVCKISGAISLNQPAYLVSKASIYRNTIYRTFDISIYRCIIFRTSDISYRACFALHPLFLRLFFMPILNKSFDVRIECRFLSILFFVYQHHICINIVPNYFLVRYPTLPPNVHADFRRPSPGRRRRRSSTRACSSSRSRTPRIPQTCRTQCRRGRATRRGRDAP